MLNSGMILQDRYEIIKVIGKGGMSTVYQAKSLEDGRLLAVKDVTRSSAGENQVVEESLSAEGRMLKQLSNPHLPRIYDIIETETNIMLIMDYVSGKSLDKVIAETGPQPMAKVLDWGMQICSVFTYLHSQPTPIIYRDMKPANVMVETSGKIMMIDFGTARTEKVGVEMQEDTVCIGTVGFAAPEQYGGIGQSTAQTDIFCLGATLYNMITGHSPCESPIGILPLERWNPALAKTPLAQIIYKCTRNDPAERYQSATELYHDLNWAKNGMPVNSSQYVFNAKTGIDSWKKQELKHSGYSGGLSGLLKRNPAEKKQENRHLATWQMQTPVQPSVQTPMQQPAPRPVPRPAPRPVQQPAPRPAPKPVQQPTPRPAPKPAQQPTPRPTQQSVLNSNVSQNSWQGIGYSPVQPVNTAPNQKQGTDRWKKLAIIGAIIAALFVVLGMILLICEQTLISLILLIIAAGSVILALTGIILSRMNPVN